MKDLFGRSRLMWVSGWNSIMMHHRRTKMVDMACLSSRAKVWILQFWQGPRTWLLQCRKHIKVLLNSLSHIKYKISAKMASFVNPTLMVKRGAW